MFIGDTTVGKFLTTVTTMNVSVLHGKMIQCEIERGRIIASNYDPEAEKLARTFGIKVAYWMNSPNFHNSKQNGQKREGTAQ